MQSCDFKIDSIEFSTFSLPTVIWGTMVSCGNTMSFGSFQPLFDKSKTITTNTSDYLGFIIHCSTCNNVVLGPSDVNSCWSRLVAANWAGRHMYVCVRTPVCLASLMIDTDFSSQSSLLLWCGMPAIWLQKSMSTSRECHGTKMFFVGEYPINDLAFKVWWFRRNSKCEDLNYSQTRLKQLRRIFMQREW